MSQKRVDHPESGRWYRFPEFLPPKPDEGPNASNIYIVRCTRTQDDGTVVRYSDSDFWWYLHDTDRTATWTCKGWQSVTHWMVMPEPPEDEEVSNA